MRLKYIAIALASCVSMSSFAQKPKPAEAKESPKDPFYESSTYNALKFRSLGPAVTSGRVGDILVNPKNKSQWFIVAASGGVWKTDNAGVSFKPIFDNEESFSIGCISMDPNNSNVLWVGTGENNNQRSVAYGDGVYKSEDGGASWKRVGLEKSERIGRIVIDPTNSDIVYVAAYGSVWSAGGERGIYKTIDGGKNWKQSLTISEHTGCNDVLIDPNHTNILYAAAHQRRRHEFTYISGGPESAVYKSVDGGANWNKITKGLPQGEVGRIGLAISLVNSDFIYAIVEGDEESKGVYRSTNRGASFEKRSPWSTAGNYYQEILCDPKDENTLYSLDTYTQVSYDGGKTFKKLGEKWKHVDNHAMWVDPDNGSHMLMGCDGGLYETFDKAASWRFFNNLPITQYYRVTTDNAKPFYNIYGGTQDNNSMGGPSRTLSSNGITNADWFITVGGDGFFSRVDPKDPNIVYSEWQYGGLVRFDKKNGEAIDIKPQEAANEAALRWNWDAPFAISAFDNKRLYFCANKVFRSDDRGLSWKAISGDLSAQIDRNKLPVMGKVWSVDAVSKNQSTSIYGNITAFWESPKNENLLIVGTDDGLLQITSDGGKTWTKISSIPGVPTQTLCHAVIASQHDENILYAAFNNHRRADFKPYIVKSTDKGKTWSLINGNLPERGSVYCLAEDHKNPDLIFTGTEFGVYFTLDKGFKWVELTGGLPKAINIHEIAIQKEENDLVLATFGRGFYVLDDYSALQNLKKEDFEKEAKFLSSRPGLVYMPSGPYGHKGKSFQGESFFQTENPPIGATLTYYLKNDYKSLKELRKEREAELKKKGANIFYPSIDSLRLEDKEEAPYILLTVTDEAGAVVRRLKQSANKGLYRVTWDGRYESSAPVTFNVIDPSDPYQSEDQGYVALPGKYFAQLSKVQNNVVTNISDKFSFELRTLNMGTMNDADLAKRNEYNKELSEFRKVVLATTYYHAELMDRVKYIQKLANASVSNNTEVISALAIINASLKDYKVLMFGDESLGKREFETKSTIINRVEGACGAIWTSTSVIPELHKSSVNAAKEDFAKAYASLKSAKENLESLEAKLSNSKEPYTPGRFPVWK